MTQGDDIPVDSGAAKRRAPWPRRLVLGLLVGGALGLGYGQAIAFLHLAYYYRGGPTGPVVWMYLPPAVVIGLAAGLVGGIFWNHAIYRLFSVLVMMIAGGAAALLLLLFVAFFLAFPRLSAFECLEDVPFGPYVILLGCLAGGWMGGAGGTADGCGQYPSRIPQNKLSRKRKRRIRRSRFRLNI